MNIFDYLTWRGDLSFVQSPFCEVDNLILSLLAYINLSEVVPESSEEAISIREASLRFFSLYSAEQLKQDHSLLRKLPTLLKAAAAAERFANVEIWNYREESVESSLQQFAALELRLDDGSSFVSIRGTDDTLMGWKESLYMSNGTVGASTAAAAYLQEIGEQSERPLRVGGHSKGGNLAIYAAAKVSSTVRDRILAVYSNDGPGFSAEFQASPEIAEIRERIRRIVPDSSVFGMLLLPVAEPIVIKSSAVGLLQHDGLTWEVQGPAFVRYEKSNPLADTVNASLNAWIHSLEPDTRSRVIDDLFAVLESTGATTLSGLQKGGIKSWLAIQKNLKGLPQESQQVIQQLFQELKRHLNPFIHD